MKSYRKIENIEAIAMRFLTQNENGKQTRQDSISTLKDLEIFGKRTTASTHTHTRTRSKVFSIISNNIVLAEYNFDFFNNKKVLYKLPSKVLEDNDSLEEDNVEDFLAEVSFNDDLFSLPYEKIYNLISECYYPFIQLMIESLSDFTNSLQGYLPKIEKWIETLSPFESLFKSKGQFMSHYIYEIITIGYIIYLYQITHNLDESSTLISAEDIENIYQILCEAIERLYENIILFISYYSMKKPGKTIVSYEEKCLQHVKEFYKNNFKPSQEQMFSKVNDNLEEIKDCLGKITETIINSVYKNVNNGVKSSFSAEFLEEIDYFEKLTLILKENQKASSIELKTSLIKNYKHFKSQLKQNTIPVPYLKPIDSTKYKYTIVLDLDETLVHYVEEEERAYVQVRPQAENFLIKLGKHFELVIFTAAAEDYADIVLQELDRKGNISYRLYRKHTTQQSGVFLKDLGKLGRDLNRTCIIDNNKENFNLQPELGLHISSFTGEQSDQELPALTNDLMKILDCGDDIKPVLEVIRQSMSMRYSSNSN